MSHGLILFAHGSRDARWAAPFEAVAQRIRQARPQLQLQLAYLELMKTKPFGAVWNYYCLKHGVPVGAEYIEAIGEYEEKVLSKR